MDDIYLGNPALLVEPVTLLRAILDRMTAVAPGAPDAGQLNGVEVHLFTNDVHPTKDSVVADFTEPTFTGYAASAAVTWGAAFESEDGSAMTVGANVQFLCTADPDPAQTIYGYFVTDAAGTGLKFAERLDAPFSMDASGKALVVTPRYALA